MQTKSQEHSTTEEKVDKAKIREVLAFIEQRWGFETLVQISLLLIRKDLGL